MNAFCAVIAAKGTCPPRITIYCMNQGGWETVLLLWTTSVLSRLSVEKCHIHGCPRRHDREHSTLWSACGELCLI
eukprot:468007-Pleurochrysis_carterae.AAC.4